MLCEVVPYDHDDFVIPADLTLHLLISPTMCSCLNELTGLCLSLDVIRERTTSQQPLRAGAYHTAFTTSVQDRPEQPGLCRTVSAAPPPRTLHPLVPSAERRSP